MTALTRKEVAARLRCSERTVRRIQRDGRLRTTRPSPHKVLTLETELARYIAAASGRRGV